MIVALFPELLGVGGVQLAGRHLASALSSIAAEERSTFQALSLNDAKGMHESSVGDLNFHFQGFERAKPRFILAAIKLSLLRPQIILVAHPNLAPIALAMKILTRTSRVIVCAHGIEVWKPLPFVRQKAIRRADLVLTPSTDTTRKLIEVQRVAEIRVRKLSWALDPDFHSNASTPNDFHLPKAFPRGIVVLSVGRWATTERYKGADLLIEAISKLARQFKDLQLVLVGSGDDIPRLRDCSRRSGCAERIYFLADLSREALAACYANADIFALPSTGEGFGFVFLEAMAMKKPVIGAAVGGVPDIVIDHETGFLIDPENSASLTNALRELITSPELREKMGQRGCEIVHARFRFESFRSKLRLILDGEKPH